MASKSFKSNTGAGVTVFVNGMAPIRVEADEPYQTDDKAVIEALEGASQVDEVKSSSKDSSKS